MYYINWTGEQGTEYQLTIDNGTYAPDQTLTAGETPFITEIDNSDDLFTPVRMQTGNITIVTDSIDISDIVGQTPFSRPVMLTIEASPDNIVAWTGFLQTDAFTQTWDAGPNTITIPVWSALKTLTSRYPSNAVDDLVYTSFAAFLCEMVLMDNTPQFRYFVFPLLTEPLTTLAYQFNLLNYAQLNTDTGEYEVESYLDILTDICKLFGWQCQENGETLIFMAADSSTDYIRMTWSALNDLASGQTPAREVVTIYDVQNLSVYGNDHTITMTGGKRSVTVSGNVNNPGLDIYQMDLDLETQYLNDNYAWAIGTSESGVYVSIIYDNTGTSSVIATRDQRWNGRFEDARNDSNPVNSQSGCGITRERQFVATLATGAITSDTGWVDKILFRLGTLTSGTNLFTITVPKHYFYTAMEHEMRCFLTGTVRKSSDPRGSWENVSSGKLPLVLTVGSTTRNLSVTIVDGKFDGTAVLTTFGNESGGYLFTTLAEEGELTISMSVPADPSSLGFNTTDYFSIEDLRLSFCYDQLAPDAHKIPDTNRVKIQIGNGFIDDYSQDCGLTTRVSSYATSAVHPSYRSLTWAQYGTGIVMTDNLMDDPPQNLYDSKTPEQALADRMSAYFSASRQLIRASYFSNKLLLPWNKYTLDSSAYQLMVMAQTMDWRKEVVTGYFYEIP